MWFVRMAATGAVIFAATAVLNILRKKREERKERERERERESEEASQEFKKLGIRIVGESEE
jgi:hypothetical protein